jgi:hypothetical protein
MNIDGQEYMVIRGSDLERDGMFLELYLGREPNGMPVAECFYSDADRSLSLTVYEGSTPEAALAWLEKEGARWLPPEDRTA